MNFIETCESSFNELQQMGRDLLAGKMHPDMYMLQMGRHAQGAKWLKLMLDERKLRRKLSVNLNKGILDINLEKHECVDRDIIITRSACLDYSGDEKNHEQCKSCKYFTVNRQLFYPKKVINSK